MTRYKHLHIVGTSHVAPESLVKVKKTMEKAVPEIVALELDRNRYAALLSDKKTSFSFSSIKEFGFKGWVFGVLASFVERHVGESIGMSPGTEMLYAAQLAKEHEAKIALIDQPLPVTLRRFSATLSWREKFRFVVDLFRGPWLRKEFGFALHGVPDKKMINKILAFMEQRYPNVYKTLVVERNRYMAKQLYVILQHHSVVAVVGAGHEEAIVSDLKMIEKRLGAL